MASSIANSTKEGVISLGGNVSEGIGSFFAQKVVPAATGVVGGMGREL